MVGHAAVFFTTPVAAMLARLYGGLHTGIVSFLVYLQCDNRTVFSVLRNVFEKTTLAAPVNLTSMVRIHSQARARIDSIQTSIARPPCHWMVVLRSSEPWTQTSSGGSRNCARGASSSGQTQHAALVARTDMLILSITLILSTTWVLFVRPMPGTEG